MLWEIIREFFVKYVFGGSIVVDGATEFYGGLLGADPMEEIGTYSMPETYLTFNNINLWGDPIRLSLGDYFSLIATIITMVAILLFCVFIIKKIIGIIFRLFTGSSAF